MINILRKNKKVKRIKGVKPISIIKNNRDYKDDLMILCLEKIQKPFARSRTCKTANGTSLTKFFSNVQGLIRN
ncbi:MAG: hypothetical protein E7362_05160 [Clostridiales bacterium]|nr:hypothetical protein [Clostridiales bacterium]